MKYHLKFQIFDDIIYSFHNSFFLVNTYLVNGICALGFVYYMFGHKVLD